MAPREDFLPLNTLGPVAVHVLSLDRPKIIDSISLLQLNFSQFDCLLDKGRVELLLASFGALQ